LFIVRRSSPFDGKIPADNRFAAKRFGMDSSLQILIYLTSLCRNTFIPRGFRAPGKFLSTELSRCKSETAYRNTLRDILTSSFRPQSNPSNKAPLRNMRKNRETQLRNKKAFSQKATYL
jgi:hypothetical protein